MSIHRPTFRFDEIRLILVAAVAALAGFAVIALAASDSTRISWADLQVAALFSGAAIAISMYWSAIGFRGDLVIFPVTVMLSGIGLIVLHRLAPALDQAIGLENIDRRHLIFLLAGFAVTAVIAPIHAIWGPARRYKYTLLLVGIALLLATFIFGEPIYGARIWIRVGPVLIQPGELVKVLLVLFLAAYLEDKRELLLAGWSIGPLTLPPLPYLIPMSLMAGASVLVLVVENDLGSALMLFAAFLVMLYVATGRASFLVGGLFGFGIAAWLAYSLLSRIEVRVHNWLNPWADPLVVGWQQIQSDFALGSSGVLGQGLGKGQPWRIPVVQSDYIYSAIGEELGFLGTAAVLILLSLLVLRGARIALNAEDGYYRLVAIGLAATIGVQGIIIVSGVTRILPLTGITLPFLSYGGSSLLTNFLLVGLLLNLSGASHREEKG